MFRHSPGSRSMLAGRCSRSATGSSRDRNARPDWASRPLDIIPRAAPRAVYLRERIVLGILEGFERRLEGLVEGIFTKAFRTGLQPVELATRILREMDTSKTVGVREVWVPNRYVFFLSEDDRERFHQTEKALRRELQTVVVEGAEERGWGLVGAPEVVFQTDDTLRQGEFRCEASLVEGPTSGGARPVRGAVSASTVAPAPNAELVVVEKGKPARSFPLTR